MDWIFLFILNFWVIGTTPFPNLFFYQINLGFYFHLGLPPFLLRAFNLVISAVWGKAIIGCWVGIGWPTVPFGFGFLSPSPGNHGAFGGPGIGLEFERFLLWNLGIPGVLGFPGSKAPGIPIFRALKGFCLRNPLRVCHFFTFPFWVSLFYKIKPFLPGLFSKVLLISPPFLKEALLRGQHSRGVPPPFNFREKAFKGRAPPKIWGNPLGLGNITLLPSWDNSYGE